MGKIENTMCGQRNRDDPKGQSETRDCCCNKGCTDERLQNKGLG